MNFLEELYHGTLKPSEKTLVPNSRYHKFTTIISNNEEKLIDFLSQQETSKELLPLFSQLMEAQKEILHFCEEERFREGFQTGASCIIDAVVLPSKSTMRDIF